VRLYENDTKAQSSFLYHLSGGRLRSSGRLNTEPRAQPAWARAADNDNASSAPCA
jgi:hypothetical protein